MSTDAPFARALRVATVLLAGTMLSSSVFAQAPAPAPAAAAPAPAPQVTISRVDIVGNQRIDTSTVLAYVTIHDGDVYNAGDVDQAQKSLFNTGLFSNVRVNLDPATRVLTFTVVENPVLNQVVFEGNSKIKSEDLTKEVQLKPRAVFTRSKVQADVARIIALYRQHGKFAATVDPQIIQRPDNRVDLIFSINEGQTTGISRINFIGNRAFDDATLKKQISTSESSWWNFLQTSDNYDPDRMTYDGAKLEQFYKSNGYADFRLISSSAQLTPDRKSFFVTYTIDEGPQYKVGTVKVQSNIKDLSDSQLRNVVDIQTGEIYDGSKVAAAIDALTSAVGEKGYASADASRPQLIRDTKNHIMNLVFGIEPGPRVYVEKINISGNHNTLDKVIRREFRMAEGDVYNRVLVDRSRTRIRSLGIFKDVSVKSTPGSQPDRVDLSVQVTEDQTGQLELGAGYSSAESFVGEFSYTERNLFGRNEFLRTSLQISSISKQAQLSFTEPYFLDRPLPAGFDIYKTLSDYDSAAYQGDETGIGVHVGFPTSEFGSAGLRYSFIVDKVTPFSNASAQVLAAQGTSYTSVFGFTYSYSTLDAVDKPTKGFALDFSQDFSGLGGTLKYMQTEAHFVTYRPVLWNAFIGSLYFSAGYMNGWDNQTVPINRRFFKGGTTFRGFKIGGVGPRDTAISGDGGALGADVYAIGKFDLRIPSFLPESYGINASLFTDFGTVGHLDGPRYGCQVLTCVKDNLAFRASSGLSIAWTSPFGPLTIDIGVPFIKTPYDRAQLIRFGAATSTGG